MLIIPTVPAWAQQLETTLAGQNCEISIYQKSTGLYLDLTANGTLIIAGALCLDRNRIVRSVYLGFIGDLFFWDTQAFTNAAGQFVAADPVYSGLGSQFQLMYLEATDPASPGPQ